MNLFFKSKYFFLTIIVVFMVGIFYFVFLFNKKDAVTIDLKQKEVVNYTIVKDKINFAIAPILSPGKTFQTFQELGGYLSEKMKKPVYIIQRKTFAEINELIHQGRVDLALICTGAYLYGLNNNITMKIIVVPVLEEGPYFHSYIVVKQTSTIKKMEDLKNKMFAFTDPLSLSGHFYPEYFLSKKGYSPHKYFSNFFFTYSHDNSIKSVLEGITDACAISSLVYDFEIKRNTEYAEGLRIIHRSPPLAIAPIVAPHTISPELLKNFQDVFISMEKNPKGAKILSKLGIVRFQSIGTEIYDETASIYNNFINVKDSNR